MTTAFAQTLTPAFVSENVCAALICPATYRGSPHCIEARETLISRVFLAGDRAFKLKKPVVLPFLDYGTPERRREMCHEEVRLNRRLTTDIYLGVRAVVASADGFELADEDDPRAVDYVVEMRRFDEGDTMMARLERRELVQADVERLARELVRFHSDTGPAPCSASASCVIERRFLENFHELLAIVEQAAEIERVLDLERSAHAFIVAHAQTLDARAQAGFIRDLHGDLRAEHVLLEETVQIVDCVEFDPGLRELDVADDLAFLVMDLVAKGGEQTAEMLVRAYREAGGDPGDDSLIAFYATYRALVRAKVTLLRSLRHPVSSDEYKKASAHAWELVTLAERFAWKARRPLVIVICGAPAAGKSHLASRLAEISGLAHLSSDATRKHLVGVSPTQHAGSAAYSSDFNHSTYGELGRLAAARTAVDGGAIVDATFRHREDRDAFRSAFAAAAPVVFVECRAPVSVLADRAASRDRQASQTSDASLAVVVRESSVWDPLDEVPPSAHIALRSDRAVEAQIDDIVALLNGHVGTLSEGSGRGRSSTDSNGLGAMDGVVAGVDAV